MNVLSPPWWTSVTDSMSYILQTLDFQTVASPKIIEALENQKAERVGVLGVINGDNRALMMGVGTLVPDGTAKKMQIIKSLVSVVVACALGAGICAAQGNDLTKHFKQYKEIATNIDIYASRESDVAPFSKPVKEARQRLASFVGDGLAKGAIVICATLEQKDSINEARLLKMGYKWALIQMTPEATAQQMMAQMKAQMGGELPDGMLERFKNRSPEQKAAGDARLVSSTVLRMNYAVLMTTLAPEREFRSSRLDDLSRSPLADWLDVGLASYASGGAALNLRFLQEHLDETFPFEDLLSMTRPFVAPTEGGSGNAGGGQMIIRMGGNAGAGAGNPAGAGSRSGGSPAGGGGARGGGGGFNMPKDVQDRLTFDCQAASFFSYMVEKVGIEKAREVVQWNRDGKLAREALARPGYLGDDLDQIEKDWQDWVKKQKGEGPSTFRMMSGGPPSSATPAEKP